MSYASAPIFDGENGTDYLSFDLAEFPSALIPRVTDNELARVAGTRHVPEETEPIMFSGTPQTAYSAGGRLYTVPASWVPDVSTGQPDQWHLPSWWTTPSPTGERLDTRATPAAEVSTSQLGGWLVATFIGFAVAYFVATR